MVIKAVVVKKLRTPSEKAWNGLSEFVTRSEAIRLLRATLQ